MRKRKSSDTNEPMNTVPSEISSGKEETVIKVIKLNSVLCLLIGIILGKYAFKIYESYALGLSFTAKYKFIYHLIELSWQFC